VGVGVRSESRLVNFVKISSILALADKVFVLDFVVRPACLKAVRTGITAISDGR